MRVSYNEVDSVLHITTGKRAVDGASFLRGPDAAVLLGTLGGHDIVGLIVIGAAAYLPLGRGYDAERDILTIGETTDDTALITETGDFVGYWEVDASEPDGFETR